MTLQEAKKILANILEVAEPERHKRIFKFQHLILESKPTISEESLYEILDDLSLDLNYYEPNPEWRKECNLDGEEKLIENIKKALQAIEALEIKNQNLQHEKD